MRSQSTADRVLARSRCNSNNSLEIVSSSRPLVVYPFPEKGEAGASIDSVGSLRVDVVTKLKEMGNGVMVSASKEEGRGTQ
jgi:hypothetical protein